MAQACSLDGSISYLYFIRFGRASVSSLPLLRRLFLFSPHKSCPTEFSVTAKGIVLKFEDVINMDKKFARRFLNAQCRIQRGTHSRA